MNLEPYRALFADLELQTALARISELEHTVSVLDVAIANYQDAWTAR